jgi:uncharacterized protein with FMN-binding domain
MQSFVFRLLLGLLVLGALPLAARAATVELLDGSKLECKVLSRNATEMVVEVTMGGAAVERTIPLTTVHKVTINAKTYVINEKPAGSKTKSPKSSKSSKAKSGGAADDSDADKPLRTKAQIDTYINEQGRTPPEWFDETPLDYPPSLDLSWPEPVQGGWNNQKNIGQYVWDVINPNSGKWRSGVKLMHHLLTLHQDDATKRKRIMIALGRMYHNLHQDYARAAFWWRQAGVDNSAGPPGVSVHLAECYWRLGNKQMAVDYLKRMPSVPYDAIKLYADMGETNKALAIVAATVKSPTTQHHFAFLYAGDACRVAGRQQEALDYYQKVLDLPATGKAKGQIERCQRRAGENLAAMKLYDLSDVKNVADGTYQDEAIGYEGPVRVEVVVKSSRIESVSVVQHREKQYYSSIADTPVKIVAKQGIKGVDATSSATITSEAIINATAKALAKGAK